MGKLFGTDGARGVANVELTCDIAFKMGQAAVVFLGKTIVIGKDTRLSGDMLEAAVEAGITSMGGTALAVGIVPTPAIALMTRELQADGGIVISASHNPPEYNGIKCFDGEGFKLPDSVEEAIEKFVLAGGAQPGNMPKGDAVGTIVPVDHAAETYIQHAVEAVQKQGVGFGGLKLAVDTGHGAASATTPEALRRLGAEVIVINDDYNGTDINVKCGSTCLDAIKELVLETGADFGIAHDGDADRVILVDCAGNELDGDVVEVACALDLKKRGRLSGNTIVSTVMCNLGLRLAMQAAGIEVKRTDVGDRYVLECMREHGFVLGGEQSGHMIFLEHNSTGDGLMTACQFLAACVRNGWTGTKAFGLMRRYPQVTLNVEVPDKDAYDGNQKIKDTVNWEKAALGNDGQVLVRKSGTESLIRVTVEAITPEQAELCANRIAAVVRSELTC